MFYGKRMTQNYDNIIKEAKKLVTLIKNHEITTQYQTSLTEINKNIKSQELLNKLVLLGKEINDQLSQSKKISPTQTKEFESLKNELNKNNLVKTHISNQNAYSKMLQEIIDLIKDPLAS